MSDNPIRFEHRAQKEPESSESAGEIPIHCQRGGGS
jgi:hypothetical protein